MMNYEEFMQKSRQMESEPVLARKTFYADILAQETEKTAVRMAAYFQYALLFYYEGDFLTAREVLEPFVIDYRSYDYRPEVIACFNLMGMAAYCECQYALARFYIEEGLNVALQQKELSRYAYEYNNLALTYEAQENYTKALEIIRKAEEHLPESDDEMRAYVYLNMSEICCHLGELDDARAAYEKCVGQFNGYEILPDDTQILGMQLNYKQGHKDNYRAYRARVLEKMPQMHASEFISAAKALFECGLDAKDTAQVEKVLTELDNYMQEHPQETQVGWQAQGMRYIYAKARGDRDAMLDALERRDGYYARIMEHAEDVRVRDVDRYLRIGQRLQKALASEASANRTKTRFLANMSHDIRTPINGIMGMLTMIEAYRGDNAKVDDCLEKIDISSKHLLSLVNDVLDMTKLESDSFTVEEKPFDLDALGWETCRMVESQAEQAGLHVYTEHDDVSGLTVLGSELYLKKILLNLFSNCIKYNKPDGSIYTRLRLLDRTEDHVTCEFSIRDTGLGMTQDFIDNHLFEAFTQGANAARSRYDGTGLGMAIVAQLVKKMNGTITVESKVGEGSCFTVVLPFAVDHTPPAEKALEMAIPSLEGRRLLLVEDNDLNMEIAEFILTSAGAEVVKAWDGAQALQLYRQAAPGTFDAVLLDLMMPVMDGYEAARAIRNSGHADAADLPLIAMSANAYAEDVQKCLKCGMNAHVSKPLFKDALLKTLAEYMK